MVLSIILEAVLLQQKQTRDDEGEREVERKFKNVKYEYLKYYTSIVSDIREGELGLLLQKSFSSTQVDLDAQTQGKGQAEAISEVETHHSDGQGQN